MKPFSWDQLRTFLNGNEPPCISVYQPTHRRPTEAHQDRVLYRNLLREIEQALRERYSGREARPMLERFNALADDEPFWQHQLDGLAVLAAGSRFEIHRLQRPVGPLAVVNDHFHLKPLVRYLQSADRYQVLCLTRTQARFYQGNRYGLDPLELGADFPSTLTRALGEQVTKPQGFVHASGPGTAMHGGQGTRKDEVGNETERFFRIIDREVLARASRASRLPLVLVALAEHQAVFRQLSQNPFLLPVGVPINPEELKDEQLRQQVWQVVQPQYLDRLARICDDFQTAQSRQKGSADLSDIGRAAIAGRIGALLVDADRMVPGRFDLSTGAISGGAWGTPEVSDLLDDIAEEVLRRNGEVVVVPGERMPTKTGLAATFRF